MPESFARSVDVMTTLLEPSLILSAVSVAFMKAPDAVTFAVSVTSAFASMPTSFPYRDAERRPSESAVAALYVVSVNSASAGTLFLIVNPLSWIMVPDVPENVATWFATLLLGPETAPTIFTCRTF